jgi:hypothetical protein
VTQLPEVGDTNSQHRHASDCAPACSAFAASAGQLTVAPSTPHFTTWCNSYTSRPQQQQQKSARICQGTSARSVCTFTAPIQHQMMHDRNIMDTAALVDDKLASLGIPGSHRKCSLALYRMATGNAIGSIMFRPAVPAIHHLLPAAKVCTAPQASLLPMLAPQVPGS